MNVVDSLTRRSLPARSEPLRACVLHTTGDTDLAKILRWYQSADGLQPHYAIDLSGTIHRIVDEMLIAYHAKIDPAEARLYQQGWGTWSEWVWINDTPVHRGEPQTNYRAWRETWVGAQSPLDLLTGDHPNSRSIGIELQQPEKPVVDIFTDAQYAALSELLQDIGSRYGLPLARSTLLTHYDVSPLRRSNARGSWDPGAAFSFNRLFDLIGSP